MQYDKITGLEKKISKLIMGNDNQNDYDVAAKLWDHWIDVGGNAFDNAHIYGGGSMETLLGKWHKSRNNLKDLVIIAKGAHTPNCDPKSISTQLTESLDRLQCESADVYIMHRDNLDIPIIIFTKKGLSLNNVENLSNYKNIIVFTESSKVKFQCQFKKNINVIQTDKFDNKNFQKFIKKNILRNSKKIFKISNKIIIIYISYPRKNSRANTAMLVTKDDFK